MKGPRGTAIDQTGYSFRLGKLDEYRVYFINAETVKTFIPSAEHRRRFGQR
ncbi:MAG TPA: hypothetical protein VF659_05440 [Pyrinomonadaceae bacterium]